MAEIFGNFIENFPSSEEYLIIGFSPSSIPLKQRWRNNGLSADFLADYFTTFLPADESEDSSLNQHAEIKGAVSYIANELLENAMKFNDDQCDLPISIALYLGTNNLVFQITNSIPPEAVKPFQEYIEKILSSDPQDLYLEQLEKNALDEEGGSSRLGYLTMINDYMATLGWKFEKLEQKPIGISVTTMVQLTF
ncbi:ATP-binding protein [Spirulina subsalsa FACHB-351]|uniref:ATP-binding protein n=1 Tax=Spirulina subsalsa FACHB-351 TaxID=234711 RepID=A0ABT3L8D1_9CYAN|nr:ATP-binding protein [Spirulina subsalsa]MCW6037744.1 ATP-binding protein [Spirulina subsalsa FACHB-351]